MTLAGKLTEGEVGCCVSAIVGPVSNGCRVRVGEPLGREDGCSVAIVVDVVMGSIDGCSVTLSKLGLSVGKALGRLVGWTVKLVTGPANTPAPSADAPEGPLVDCGKFVGDPVGAGVNMLFCALDTTTIGSTEGMPPEFMPPEFMPPEFIPPVTML